MNDIIPIILFLRPDTNNVHYLLSTYAITKITEHSLSFISSRISCDHMLLKEKI